MSDEVADGASPSVDLKTNQITVLCCEHVAKVDMQVKSFESVRLAGQSVDDDIVHVAKEALITSNARIGKASTAVPIFATLTCKTSGFAFQKLHIEGCINAFRNVASQHLNGDVLAINGTDGDAISTTGQSRNIPSVSTDVVQSIISSPAQSERIGSTGWSRKYSGNFRK